MQAYLILANGRVFRGQSIGCPGTTIGAPFSLAVRPTGKNLCAIVLVGPNASSTRYTVTRHQASSAASIAAKKKKPPPPVPSKRLPSVQQAQYVTALFDFDGQAEGDLSFRDGDRIRIVKKTDSVDDWWDGELNGMTGCFPANYVRIG